MIDAMSASERWYTMTNTTTMYTVEQFEKLYTEWKSIYEDTIEMHSLDIDDKYTLRCAMCDALESADDYMKVIHGVDSDIVWFFQKIEDVHGAYFAMDDMVYLRNGYSLDLCTGYVYNESDAA